LANTVTQKQPNSVSGLAFKVNLKDEANTGLIIPDEEIGRNGLMRQTPFYFQAAAEICEV